MQRPGDVNGCGAGGRVGGELQQKAGKGQASQTENFFIITALFLPNTAGKIMTLLPPTPSNAKWGT